MTQLNGPYEHIKTTRNCQWIVLFVVILSIKLVVYIIDHSPMFFLGDSESYIYSALTGWVPPDRSFVYGILIKLISVKTHSLQSLIFFQILLSSLSALFLCFCLKRYFNAPFRIGAIMSILFTIDPLQLLLERYVLTETTALFLLCGYLILSLEYLKQKYALLLVAIQILGVLLISIRVSFLPLIVVNMVVLPLIAVPFNQFITPTDHRNLYDPKLFKSMPVRITAHLFVSILSMLILHNNYKLLVGHLSEKPPAYQYTSGLFLLADLCPLIKKSDFTLPEDRVDVIFDNIGKDLDNRKNRQFHRWMEGGLIAQILNDIQDPFQADQVCKETAINCMKRDPIGVLLLGMATFFDYWEIDYLNRCMHTDQGMQEYPPTNNLIKMLCENFGIKPEELGPKVPPTSRYFFASTYYCITLLCSPFPAVLVMALWSGRLRRFAFVIFLASAEIVCVASFLTERPVPRYLHALSWTLCVTIGIAITYFINKYHQKRVT